MKIHNIFLKNTCLLVYLSTGLLVYLSTCQLDQLVYLSNCLLFYLSTCLLVYSSTCLLVYLSTCLLVYLSTCLLFYLSNTGLLVYLSTCYLLLVYLSTCLLVFLSTCLLVCKCRHIFGYIILFIYFWIDSLRSCYKIYVYRQPPLYRPLCIFKPIWIVYIVVRSIFNLLKYQKYVFILLLVVCPRPVFIVGIGIVFWFVFEHFKQFLCNGNIYIFEEHLDQ